MFDAGFEPTKSPYDAVAREGAAVFLDRIADDRAGNAFATQVVYTTLHELGHVFNLYHIASEPNLMAQSAGSAPDSGAFRFADEHCSLLKQCSASLKIQPGGSRWGDLEGVVSASFDPSRSDRSRERRPGLSLHIETDMAEFFRFEPVELVVTLGLSRSAPMTRARVPRVLDPAYPAFTIWIEEPGGRTRTYRSGKLACGTRRTVEITPGHPYRRDISLFGQSGGYTFRRNGPHRLWAVLDHRSTGRLRSNTVEVTVRPREHDRRRAERLAPFLRPDANAKLLFYRSSAQRDTAVALAPSLNDMNASASTACLRYSVGRVLVSAAERETDGADRQALARIGVRELGLAASGRYLSDHRKGHAEEAIGRAETMAHPTRSVVRGLATSVGAPGSGSV